MGPGPCENSCTSPIAFLGPGLGALHVQGKPHLFHSREFLGCARKSPKTSRVKVIDRFGFIVKMLYI